jgi:hypothetical protein
MPTTRLTCPAALCLPLLITACGDDDVRESATAALNSAPTITMPTAPTMPTLASDSDSPTGDASGTATDTATGGASATTPPTSDSEAQSTEASGDPTVTDPSAPSGTVTGDPTLTSSTGEPGPLACSEDLHSVVDEQGNPVEQCGPGEGCYGGSCVPACQAVEAVGGTSGCDFWAPTPPFYLNAQSPDFAGPCFAVFLANTWDSPASITVARGGQQFDVNALARIPKANGNNITYEPIPPGGLPPDEVAILFLSHRPGIKHPLGFSMECPSQPAVLMDTAVAGSGLGQAFHVVSDVPVSAYDINPYGGATSFLPSASLLFPATSWGVNHVAIAPQGSARFALVVAREDNTKVEVGPAQAFPGGNGVAPAPAGVTTAYMLNAGQMLQWYQPGDGFDPSGAVFVSDKQIGLWTGATYLNMASQTLGPGGGEAAHQQLAPVKALGDEYVGAGVVTRLANLGPESVPYRIVGAVDGTQLSYDPAPPPGAPAMLGVGQSAQFETTQYFTVRSQDPDHPFLFSQYMSGTASGTRPDCATQIQGVACGLGDEEWVSLLSPKQFQNRYIFFTDPTYGTTNLVVVRAKKDGVFADVSIECLGMVGGWQPVGGEGLYEVAHVDLERGGNPVAMCGTSRHLAESDGPFGIVVWGTDRYASYGYPAGSSIADINEIVVPVPQ